MEEIKQEKIKLDANNMYVVIDFDRTITCKESVDSWDAAGKSLGKGFENEAEELYKKYRPIELDYKISFEEKNKAMEEWYKACMDLYYKYNLLKEPFEKMVVESKLIFRKGAKEFLQEMNEKNIPVIILSAGIGNIIKIFLQENDCYFENMYIISNFLTFDENGKIEEFKADLIHTMNKTLEGHVPENLKLELEKRKYKLLLGDTIEDKKMIQEKEHKNTLLVGFLNENIEENLERYKKEFDICCIGGDIEFPKFKIN